MSVNDSVLDSCDEPELLRALDDDQKQRLTEQLDRYLQSLESGEPLDLETLDRENPDLSEVFASYLSKLDALYGVAVGFQDPTDQFSDLQPTSGSPMTLGDFTVQREIGRGGMGVVYEANQKSLNRQVALKLLPMASLLDARQIARFKNEARAAGLLQHPHIVPVYSVGSERGIHYFAMQLIDGLPVDAWILQQRESASTSRDWRSIVAWAIDIADALHYAHTSGVVHRDVKPSNLLLDSAGKIWIADFGLARCQDDRSLTVSGDLLGTMRYMSPEQATGKAEAVDHRTDIYSLAATLFEMLTLRTAVVGEDGPTLLRAIQQDEPPRLRSLLPHTPADLSVVLQKAMARRKDDRYESADQLAADLRAVLDGRPTLAKPPTVVARVGRWTARHRRSVAVAASVCAVAMLWLVASSLIILQKSNDAKWSAVQRDQYFRHAQSAVDHLGTEVAEQLASVPGAEQVRHSLLLQTLRYHEQFAAQATGDPELSAEVARTHSRIGTIVKELKSPRDAIGHFRRAAEGYAAIIERPESIPAELAAVETRYHAAQNLNHLGLALADIGESDEALQNYRQTLAIQGALVQSDPENERYAAEFALTTNNLALLFIQNGDVAQARPLLDDAIARLTTIVERKPEDELAARGLASALANRSAVTVDDPRSEIELLQRAIQIRAASVGESSNRLSASGELATLLNNLGSANMHAGRWASAEQAFTRAAGLQRQLLSIAPAIDQHRRDLATSLNNVARALQKQAKHAEAIEALDEAISLQQASLELSNGDASGHSRIGAMLHNRGSSMLALGELAAAERQWKQAIDQQQLALAIDPQHAEAKRFLPTHYSSLLRCLARGKRWQAIDAVAVSYRAAAAGNGAAEKQADRDLAAVNELAVAQ
ncbi:Serine/threonine-protein kinase PrkC [Rosistilla oblonga]|uniref:serine/threonine-protein kinase n=1 Tax=Rosistilla oblonga TaxID=2527990 RepID=UPI00118A71B2|nr:serine/threonine-protein kinase [Rosistilla oblonga]QDV14814.1 Serine/threonine-protein kinase PrkC [Rosistilla oblonga]